MEQEIQLKDRQIIEKDNRIKQMERDSQQELLKYRADIEMIKKDFNDKEKKVLSNHEKIVKSLEEKNAKLTQDCEQLLQKLKSQQKEEKTTKSITFNLFLSSKLLRTFTGHTHFVNSIDYSIFDGRPFICSGSVDKTVRVWDVENNKQIRSFDGHSDDVYCVKFSPYHYYNNNRKVICSSSGDKTIRFWDIEDNRQLQVFNGHTFWVCGIEFFTI
ncbi:WD-40 repeat-containing protein [Reticulomyxa filosa]|uniref:WD-40 repeat-containing protein n=1 Tax=Reticulomyxa filosa TaxID=46433 RepID=X6LXE2_RETFI|nr:WD-40 repeat-containing protein [Reticulomyxa filosa]|eukprot:ETO06294.1 WD-40 repeat-containing protein [Reticulomyxa filosa]